jgi:predicted kinase
VAKPLLLVVSGAPASGKTSVAEALATRLRIPIISKDTFKETLYETVGHGEAIEGAIEQAALALLFSVVESQLAAGVSVVAESNFDASSDLEPFRRLCAAHELRLVQVHCTRDEERLVERFVGRIEEGKRHPGHGDEPEDADEVRAKIAAGVWEALDLPGELLEFDKDRDDLDELVARVRAHG